MVELVHTIGILYSHPLEQLESSIELAETEKGLRRASVDFPVGSPPLGVEGVHVGRDRLI